MADAASRGAASPAVAVWGDSPHRRARAALRDLAAGRVERRLLRRPLQRRRRRPERRHAPDAAPDREPDAVPPAARARTAPGSRQDARAPSSTSSATTGRSSDSTAASARCSVARRQTSNGRSTRTSRSCPPAATWSSTRSRGTSCCASIRKRSRVRGGSDVAELRALGDIPLGDIPRETAASSSTTSTPATAAGRKCDARPVCRRRAAGPDEQLLLRAVGRLLHVDDDERIDAYRDFCAAITVRVAERLARRRERRMLRMLIASLTTLRASAAYTACHRPALGAPAGPQRAPRAGSSCLTAIAHSHYRWTPRRSARRCHARYTRTEILAAFDVGHGREGPDLAERACGGSLRPANRPLRLHARQESWRLRQRRATATTPSAPSSSTGRASRRLAESATGPALHPPAERGNERHALRTARHKRSGLLVPRPGNICQPRRRTSDRIRLEAQAPPTSGPLHVVRSRCCIVRQHIPT